MIKDFTAFPPPAYGDVVVKNVRFCDSNIIGSSASNSFINNTFEGCGIEIRGGDDGAWGSGNVIKYNVFIGCQPAIFVDYAGGIVVAENDFINCEICVALYGRAVLIETIGMTMKPCILMLKKLGTQGFGTHHTIVIKPILGYPLLILAP